MRMKSQKKTRSRIHSYFLAAGLGVAGIFAAHFSYNNNKIIKSQADIAKETSGSKREKPKYFTRKQWEEQQAKIRMINFMRLFAVQLPEVPKISHPLDAYSCIIEARILAMDAAEHGTIFDETAYLHARDCPTLPELLEDIKRNPTPEALEALRKLIRIRGDLFRMRLTPNEQASRLQQILDICNPLKESQEIAGGNHPLTVAIDLADQNHEALSIVEDEIYRDPKLEKAVLFFVEKQIMKQGANTRTKTIGMALRTLLNEYESERREEIKGKLDSIDASVGLEIGSEIKSEMEDLIGSLDEVCRILTNANNFNPGDSEFLKTFVTRFSEF